MKRCTAWGKYGVVLAALIILVSVSVAAQLPTGNILGTVKDSTGGSVAGATVTVTNTDTGFNRTAPTTDDGSYRFPALPVGHYEVKVTKEGFQTLDRTGLTLNVGSDINLELSLQVGATSQTIEVTGEAPLVDTTTSSVGNLVNDAQVTDLPLNGRNWTDLTLMQPGITQIDALQSFSGATGLNNVGTPGYNGTKYSTNGGTDRSNTFFLDGADERTMIGFNNTSVTGTSLGVDGIKEYRVVSILPTAEYGLVSGSQTTIVSKGGTNQWHGDAFEYMRNDVLDAEPYNAPKDTSNFNAAQCGANYNGSNDLFAFPCKRNAPFKKNNFGGSFGGPIQKDKTFFYAVFEGVQQRIGVLNQKTTLPAACFVTPSGAQFVNPTTGASVATSGADLVTAGAVGSGTPGVIPATIANNFCVPGSVANPITVPAAIRTLAGYFPMPNVPLTQATTTFNWDAPYTQPTTEQYGQIRFDHTFSANDSAFFRYTQDDATTLPINGGSNDPRSLNNDHSAQHFGTLSETHIFTPTVLNTTRLSYSRNLQHLIPDIAPSNYPGLPTEPISVAAGTLFVTDVGNFYQQPGNANPGAIPALSANGVISAYGTAAGLSNNVGPGVADSDIYTFSDDVYWNKGKHSFKFGTLINRYDWFSSIVFTATGSVTFPGAAGLTADSCLNATQCPLAGYFEGVYSSLTRAIPNSQFNRGFRGYTYGFYAQDDYKVASHVTLNLGLRYEIASVPYEFLPNSNYSIRFPFKDTTGTQGVMFRNPSLHNFSPRLGFAWDVFGNGKTSLRGGAGLYYDVGTYGNLEQSNSISTPPVSGSVSYTDPNLNGASCCTAANGTTGQFRDIAPFSVPLPAVTNQAVPSPRTVDYNLNQPTMLQRSLGIDQQLPWQMALSVTYVGSRSWHLYQEREGDPISYYANIPSSANAACDTLAGCAAPKTGVGAVPTITTSCVGNPNCTAIPTPFSGLPFYCSPADGSSGPPSAAHPCFSNATTIACTTALTAPAGQSPSCPARFNPAWNQVSNVTTSGDNYFNSLQIVVTKRTTHGLQFQVSYTWQKLLDTGNGQSTSESSGTNLHQFPVAGGGPNGTIDRGPSNYNATDAIRGSLIYRVPDFVKADSLLGKFADGWGMSAIPTWQSGYPLSILDTGRSLDGAVFGSDRVSLCPNYNPATFKNGANSGNRGTGSTYFDLSQVCLQPAGTFGNSPKGFFTGPSILSQNVSFTKDTKARFLGEAGNVQFRFEMFNVLNHPLFAEPTTTVFNLGSNPAVCPGGGSVAAMQTAGCGNLQSATAGQPSLTTFQPMRQMQVSLKVIW